MSLAESKPIVGVNADFRGRRERAAVSWLAAGYADRLAEAGAVPMVLPIVDGEEDLERQLDAVDGVVLTGGGDLDPRRDGWMVHPSQRLLDPRRETFDRRLVRLAAERRLPVLAIGAGMQVLNVSQGGTLLLHLPEDRPRALPHFDPHDPCHRHGLVVEPDSVLGRIYGDGDVMVNSSHHMAVDDVAQEFWVTARAFDGVVEAIESVRPDWFALGVQWHPESETASALDAGVFEEFVAAVAGRRLPAAV